MGGTDRGHYTSFCKRGEKWFYFDDDAVREVTNLEDLVVNHGYLLFYRKRALTQSW